MKISFVVFSSFLGLASGCSSSSDAPVTTRRDNEPSDAGEVADTGEPWAGIIDRSRYGEPCETSPECSTGTCVVYAGSESRCVDVANPCDLVTCAAGYHCVIKESYPVQVGCTPDSP